MGTRLLVIGAESLRDRLAASLPACEVLRAELALQGIWQAGTEPFRGFLLSPELGPRLNPTVRALRKVSPQGRIVVACAPIDEPIARAAVESGANDYVLEPWQRDDVERAFGVVGPREHFAPAQGPGPDADPFEALGDVLQNLPSGPRETLDLLAALVCRALAASGVVIQIDDLAASSGDVADPVLEELIEREGGPVGRIAAARRVTGSYTATDARRLKACARLVDEALNAARCIEHWRRAALSDELSGLLNRRGFERRFDELLADTERRRSQLSLFLFDIDDFKSYNDRYGHQAGDNMIREVAHLLRSCTRESDVVARVGGDEFAVVFWEAEQPRVPGSRHPADLLALTRRFCRLLGEHPFQFLGADRPGPVTICGGLASFPWDGRSRDELMRAADDALLAGKRTSKNTVRLAGPADGEPAAAPKAG